MSNTPGYVPVHVETRVRCRLTSIAREIFLDHWHTRNAGWRQEAEAALAQHAVPDAPGFYEFNFGDFVTIFSVNIAPDTTFGSAVTDIELAIDP